MKRMGRETVMLPRLKEETYEKEKRLYFEKLSFPELSGKFAAVAAAIAEAYGVRAPLAAEFCASPLVEVGETQSGKIEYYEIRIGETGVRIFHTGELSFRNAVVTLFLLIGRENGRFYLPCGFIRDWADSAYRGFMIDLARKYLPMHILRCELRMAAFAKYNAVHLRLLDAERYALKSEAAAAINTDGIRQYTAEELRSLDRYAASLGLRVVPEIDFPAHGITVLEKFPQLHCVKNGEKLGIWTACVAKEGLYELIETLIAELGGIFGGEYVHIGGDELGFRDLKELKRWAYWEQCDDCRALFEKYGYLDESDLLCHFLRRVYGIAKRHGKKLAMWNDCVDISRSPDLPRDILVYFWRIAYPGRGPHAGCSLDRWLEEGFSVVNCFFEETYLDDFVEEEKLLCWNPKNSPKIEAKNEKGIVGGQLNVFEVKHHYAYSLPSALLICGDRLWNDAALTDTARAAEDLDRQLVGVGEDIPEFFRTIGQLVFPKNDPRPCGAKKADRADITALKDKLLRVYYSGYGESPVLREFIWCANALLIAAEEERCNPPEGAEGELREKHDTKSEGEG